MNESPPEIPELLSSVPGPDPSVRRRLAARLDALIEDERAGRVRTPRRPAPRWSGRVAVLVLVAALVVVLFVPLPQVSLFHRIVATAPKPSASTTTTTPPSTSVPYPSGGGPWRAGERVPFEDLFALSFFNDMDGAALVVVSPSIQVDQLAVTHDGGRSWTAVGGVLPLAPLVGAQRLSSIAWTSSSGGFAWGSSALVQLYDGGRRWQTIGAPAGLGSFDLSSVAALGDSVWASFTCATNCPASMWSPSSVWSWSSSTGWRPLAISSQLGGAYVPDILRLPSGTDLVLAQAPTVDQVGKPSGYLFESLDGGVSWTRKALPCGDLTGLEGASPQRPFEATPNPTSVVELATPVTTDEVVGGPIVLECQAVDSIMHLEPASVWVLATPVAGSWQLLADDLSTATVLYPRLPRPVGVAGWSWASVLVQAPTPGTLWMDGGHAGPARSTDGGREWQIVSEIASGDRVLPALDFVDAAHGWCLFAEQSDEGLWSTSDGGVTWTELGS